MRTKEFVWQNDRRKVEVVVTEANVLTGIRHTMTERDMREIIDIDEKGKDLMTIAEKLVRVYPFPAILAGTTSVKVTPKQDSETGKAIVLEPDEVIDITTFSFANYLQLPQSLALEWERAIMSLNDHWRPQVVTESKNQKSEEPKSSPSTAESSGTSALKQKTSTVSSP